MNDENPNKRCFHCVFEETKGTPKNNGDGSDSRGQHEINSPSFGVIRRISYAQLTTLLWVHQGDPFYTLFIFITAQNTTNIELLFGFFRVPSP